MIIGASVSVASVTVDIELVLDNGVGAGDCDAGGSSTDATSW